MSYSINATNARLIARADLTIFNETQALMKQVITDAGNGLYETQTDGTTMTESIYYNSYRYPSKSLIRNTCNTRRSNDKFENNWYKFKCNQSI